ncbi:MAG: hypothetical protein ACR2PB_08940 [Desulfocapsaceae bacterium]
MTTNPTQSPLIEAQLKKILNSAAFKGATKLKQFLGYVVEKYCDGSADDIKQYNIGVEAFSLKQDFDPQQDPIVRIMAGKVRRRLAEYYSSEGIDDELLVEIPKGSYVPKITNKKLTTGNAVEKLSSESQSLVHNLKIAVVPFQNISGDAHLDYFADGVAEEITSILSQYKDFSIVPPIATRNVVITRLTLQDIGREFNVRYVLDGSIRSAGQQVRIIVRLNDVSDHSMVWTSTYDTEINVDNLINIQDEIATEITNSIANEYGGIISQKVIAESAHKEHPTLSTYEAVLHMHHYNLVSAAHVYNSTLEAVTLAIEKDPNNPMLLSVLSELKIDGYSHNWSKITELPAIECQELINKALTYDKNCAYAYFVWGLLETNQRNKKELLVVVDHLMMFEQSGLSLAQAGWFLAVAGEYEEGLKLLDEQVRKLQYYPGWFNHAFFLNHYENRRFDEALEYAKEFKMPGLLWDHVDRAAALVQLDRLEESQQVLRELLNVCPDFFETPRRYLNCYLMRDDLVDHVLKGLTKVRND